MDRIKRRGGGRQVLVTLVLPERLIEATRTYAARVAKTRNAVVLEAVREYAPTLKKEQEHCRR